MAELQVEHSNHWTMVVVGYFFIELTKLSFSTASNCYSKCFDLSKCSKTIIFINRWELLMSALFSGFNRHQAFLTDNTHLLLIDSRYSLIIINPIFQCHKKFFKGQTSALRMFFDGR